MPTNGSERSCSTVTSSWSASGWLVGNTATGLPRTRVIATSSGGRSSPPSRLTSPRSRVPSRSPVWISVCCRLRTSTVAPGLDRWCRWTAGSSSRAVPALTVPIRIERGPLCCVPAIPRSRWTASSTSSMPRSSSRPSRLMRAPERRRSRRVTPSSRSSFEIASLSAGCETCRCSLARRSDPNWVTAATYSSCSMRMGPPRCCLRPGVARRSERKSSRQVDNCEACPASETAR